MRKRSCLSEGIKEAIFKTTGVLSPEHLEQFLKQIRGRKTKFKEITYIFTKRISALIYQLKLVEKNFYRSVKAESHSYEERCDLQFLERLRKRLQDLIQQ